MQLILMIAPFYLAWKLLEFVVDAVLDIAKRRRGRRTRPPLEGSGDSEARRSKGRVVLYVPGFLIGGGIGLVLAWIIGQAL
jgi:hypothetical protein